MEIKRTIRTSTEFIACLFIAARFASLACLGSCASLKDFAASPQGEAITVTGAALIVSEAVQREPQLIPIFATIADTQDGEAVDFTMFEDIYVAGAVQTVGSLVAYYGDENSARMISQAIRLGLAQAPPESSK